MSHSSTPNNIMSAADFFRFLHAQLIAKIPTPTTSFAGKTVIVSGSSSGLGKEAALHFARLGASTLILAVRNLPKGAAVKAEIESSTGCGPDVVRVWELEMESYDSVKRFSQKVDAELERVDVVVANAGIMSPQYILTEEDDKTITVNVVSTFLLLGLLVPTLRRMAHEHSIVPTFTIVTSEGHRTVKFDIASAPEGQIFSKLNDRGKGDWDGQDQYSASKLIQIMSVRELTQSHSDSTFPVTINTVNPGLCHSCVYYLPSPKPCGTELTNNLRDLTGSVDALALRAMLAVLARSAEEGSRTLVHASAQGQETHGKYLSECVVTKPSSFLDTERGVETQKRVWVELQQKLEAIQPGIASNFQA